MDIFRLAEVAILLATALFISQQVYYMRQALEVQKESEKIRRSLEFITRFNSNEFVTLRGKAVSSVENEEEDAHSVHAFLNFYEEMALSIIYEMAHEEICCRFFRQPFDSALKMFDKMLPNSLTGYTHLRKLRERWTAKTTPVSKA